MSHSSRRVYIAVPAWGEHYIALAVRYTIPAAVAALDARVMKSDVVFVVHTDNPSAFDGCFGSYAAKFFRVPNSDDVPPKGNSRTWAAFKRAHRACIDMTPDGAILVLLNSDIVSSIETFNAMDRAFKGGAKVIVSVGVRTLAGPDCEPPPIGVDALTLNEWIWSHRHHITDELVWGVGRAHTPTLLFFTHGDPGVVSMHGFHLTPMFMVKDRPLNFSGTIDDDLLEKYNESEIYYVRNREMAFAELSPIDKTSGFGRPLSIAGIGTFGRGRFSKSHIRNFRQRIAVLGNPSEDHAVVEKIISAVS